MIHLNKRIKFHWPELGITAAAVLSDDKNPELCREVWESLPLESIQCHPIVSGASLFSWVPMLSFAEVHFKERIDRAPIGRVRYSQTFGNKIAIQYGSCTEDTYQPVLGQIEPEDIGNIREVGRAAWDSLFFTKKLLRVRCLKSNNPRLPDSGSQAASWSV